MKSKYSPDGTGQNEMLSDLLNILNQKYTQTLNTSHARTSLFWGVVKGGWGAAANNNAQPRKIPSARADTCNMHSPPSQQLTKYPPQVHR